MKRKSIPNQIILQVLTESGYCCAVATCRTILAIDIHHPVEVSKDGGNEIGNLLPLCPTCHALFHRGTISPDSIYAWKLLVVSLSRAFDTSAIDDLLFLASPENANLLISGDGVLRFTRLIAAGLATSQLRMQNGPLTAYQVLQTTKGKQLIDAWKSGDRKAVSRALGEEHPVDGGLAIG